jgi:predicted enzyme related to lactoylglutathione lyase
LINRLVNANTITHNVLTWFQLGSKITSRISILTFRYITKYKRSEDFVPMSNQRFKNNAIGHFDVSGPDIQQLGKFYSAVFGWQIDPKGPGYAMLKTPDGTPGGALVETVELDQAPSLTIGVIVGDLDQALQVAAATGGKVVMPETDNGWVKKAQVSDPAGNCITLIQA